MSLIIPNKLSDENQSIIHIICGLSSIGCNFKSKTKKGDNSVSIVYLISIKTSKHTIHSLNRKIIGNDHECPHKTFFL